MLESHCAAECAVALWLSLELSEALAGLSCAAAGCDVPKVFGLPLFFGLLGSGRASGTNGALARLGLERFPIFDGRAVYFFSVLVFFYVVFRHMD